MAADPLSSEVVGALAGFFRGGAGPTHAQLSSVFLACGVGDDYVYAAVGGPSKELRVNRAGQAAIRQGSAGGRFVDQLVERLRLHGVFEPPMDAESKSQAKHLRRALMRNGFNLSTDGYVSAIGEVDLSTGGRESLDEQLDRIRRSQDDPGVLLGTAKDVLEATAKFVLHELGIEPRSAAKFQETQFMARDRLKLNPQDVDMTIPGAEHVRAILQSSVKIAEAINELRALQGVGHGRVLPTGVTPELAQLVIREACSVAELMLTTHDRMHGRTI